MRGKKLGDAAKEKLAREIVAFSNTYGGILIVEIEESNDNPKRAKKSYFSYSKSR